jgi:Ubiquinol-cytochrome C reductase, UQCRX/QCR9 like
MDFESRKNQKTKKSKKRISHMSRFGFLTPLYKRFFSKNSMFFGGVVVGAFVFEGVASNGVNALWNALNSGKQWDDILPAVEARWEARLAEEAEDDDWDDDDEDYDDDDE